MNVARTLPYCVPTVKILVVCPPFTQIPNHPGDVPEGTLRAILKQADVDAEGFLQKK